MAFNLPEVTSPLVHTIVMKEWEDEFAPQSSVQHAPPGRDEVQLRESDGLLRVMLVAQLWPAVLRHRPPAVRLRPGEWLRWQITYRRASFLGHGPWYYSLDTLNLAFGTVTTMDVFLGTPTRFVDERTQLTTYHHQPTN